MQIIAQGPAAATLTVSSGAAQSPFLIAAGLPGAGSQLNLNAPGTARLNGQPFTVRAAGYITCPAGTYTSAATPIQYALWGANTASFAAASGNLLWSAASYAIFTISSSTAKTVPWTYEVQMEGDTVSGLIVGRGSASVTTSPAVTTRLAYVTPTNVEQTPTTMNFSTEPPIQFAAGVITAASNLLNIVPSTTVTLTSLILEA